MNREPSLHALLWFRSWVTIPVANPSKGLISHFGTASALALIQIVAAFVLRFLTLRVLGERSMYGA